MTEYTACATKTEDFRYKLRKRFEIDEHPLEFIRLVSAQRQSRMRIETLEFATRNGERVRGYFTKPDTDQPVPALLTIHAHGANYALGADELLQGRSSFLSPVGPLFADIGIACLMIDMPCFGPRHQPDEQKRAKAALWHGRSLAGQMLGEQASAFSWLKKRNDIVADRIGVFGLSMGATLGYWLAACLIDIRCAVHLCCFADFDRLIDTGAHDLHGIYLTVPGLLDMASNGQIAGLIAPRPQFIGVGDTDPLTPPNAFDPAWDQACAAYSGSKHGLVLHREPDSGHCETDAMRKAYLSFIEQHLLGR